MFLKEAIHYILIFISVKNTTTSELEPIKSLNIISTINYTLYLITVIYKINKKLLFRSLAILIGQQYYFNMPSGKILNIIKHIKNLDIQIKKTKKCNSVFKT